VKLPAPPWIAIPHRGRSSVPGDGVPVEQAQAVAIVIKSKKHLQVGPSRPAWRRVKPRRT